MKTLLKGILAFAMAFSLTGCGDIAGSDDAYTYNDYVGSSKVQSLNLMEYVYNDEYKIMELTNSPLYSLVYTKDAPYKVQNEMAKEAPVDVTSEVAGTYGVPSDAKEGYAFKIALRDNLVWDDGTKIDASTFIYSMQQLLNPEMANYRASRFAEGTYEIAGAYEYAYGVDKDGNEVSASVDDLGIFKNDDLTFTLVFARPMASEFYLYYGLLSSWLVNPDLFESNKMDADGLLKSAYGTSVETYSSSGPYKLVNWQKDKIVSLEKNDKWYGWSDKDFAGQYQTTNINFQIIDKNETAMMLFLQGNLDNVNLESTDLAAYGTSDYAIYSPNTYTQKLSFNTDYDSLKARSKDGINKTIFTYKKFREAVSLSIDRNAFVQAVIPNGEAAYGLYNELYVYDPDNGYTYRDSEPGKKALLTTYSTDDITKLSGYNKALAAKLFEEAYQEALSDGEISATDRIVMEFNCNSINDTLQNTINFLNDAVVEATKGTSLENRVFVEGKEVDDHYAAMISGTCDIHIAAWTGGAFDPFSLMDCYCFENFYCDSEGGFDNQQTFSATIDGVEFTLSFEEWNKQLNSGRWATAPVETRLQVLAALEENLLTCFNTIPLYTATTASMLSQKVEYVTYDYSPYTQFGGIRFMTYNYSDAKWEEYCAKQNNQLVY